MNEKTYKREVSLLMLLFLGALFVVDIVVPTLEAGDTARFLTLPIFTFAGAAFGIDAYFKQGK